MKLACMDRLKEIVMGRSILAGRQRDGKRDGPQFKHRICPCSVQPLRSSMWGQFARIVGGGRHSTCTRLNTIVFINRNINFRSNA